MKEKIKEGVEYSVRPISPSQKIKILKIDEPMNKIYLEKMNNEGVAVRWWENLGLFFWGNEIKEITK